jgi:hypothetical protein
LTPSYENESCFNGSWITTAVYGRSVHGTANTIL